ncbi:hypothetical protein [Chryseobacterium sp. CCH4-E10]|uniref:hypothetical protein n=1 Tax=Chryseobacterium sp. CCH4-E10 TaxID=1768758 RepID=UPI00082D704D|nr:hypothetical protein [Chryseobacterium sp. CCH4-E10]
MKKDKISLEAYFWSAQETQNPFKLIDDFFGYSNLDESKRLLNEIVLHTYKKEIYKKDYPAQVFDFYKSMRSFLRACYCLQSKSKKWKIKNTPNEWFIIGQASLTSEEYQNPFTVFHKAFSEKTLEEFEFFLSEVVHFSLSPLITEYVYDLTTPYIHLIKMLDASQIIN